MATINGAKVLGLENKVGSLKKDKLADFIMIERDSINMFPIYDAYSAIVYSATSSNVNDVFINGVQVVNNKVSIYDKAQIKNNLIKSMKHFEKRSVEKSKELWSKYYKN